MNLVAEVYRLCAVFPREETYGLSAQLKRAAVSIPSNIAEGARRRRRKPFVLHLEVALGSQAELEVQLELAAQLGFVNEADYNAIQEQADHIGRMLNRLIDRLRNDPRLTTND